MVFRPLATASGKGIETDEAAFKLMGAFTKIVGGKHKIILTQGLHGIARRLFITLNR